jgi:hypothetical protein
MDVLTMRRTVPLKHLVKERRWMYYYTYLVAGAWKWTFMDCVTPTPLMPLMSPRTTKGVLQQLVAS